MIGSVKIPLVMLHHDGVQHRWVSGVGCIAVTDVVIRGHCYGLYVVVLCRQEVQDCAITMYDYNIRTAIHDRIVQSRHMITTFS